MARRRKKRPLRPLGDLTKKDLSKMVKDGMSDTVIGKVYGVSRQAVAQKRWDMGIEARTAKNEARNAKILKAYERGVPSTQIAEKYGLSVSQTYRIINQE